MDGTWRVVVLEEVEAWILSLPTHQRLRVLGALVVLSRMGPGLGRPKVDSVRQSRHKNMKELREGTIRVLFAFDPARSAVVLVGGDKRDRWASWYLTAIPRADDLFDTWIEGMGK